MKEKQKKAKAKAKAKAKVKEQKKKPESKELAEVGKKFITAQDMDGDTWALVNMVAKENHLPLTGITILGGKPYVNTTGLDSKLQRDKRRVKRISAKEIKKATEDDLSASYTAVVEFEDTEKRMEARAEVMKEGIKAGRSKDEIIDIIEELGLAPPIYRAYGYASKESIKMKTLHNSDCINMMAERRATNRAKRQAVGCGLTSIDEMSFGWEQFLGFRPAEGVEVIEVPDLKKEKKTEEKKKGTESKKNKSEAELV